MLGQIVQYKLSHQDVETIVATVPRFGTNSRSNYNVPDHGDVFPAIVVRDNSGASVNLKVLLDGGPGAEYWATSRVEGEDEGQWTSA